MAYYADLLADGVEQQSGGVPGLEELSDDELREAWECLLAAGVPQPEEAQAGWLAPVRQGLGWLVRRNGGATLASRIRELDASSWPATDWAVTHPAAIAWQAAKTGEPVTVLSLTPEAYEGTGINPLDPT
ncbi:MULTISPECIES: hypothetical protein [unclassified Streptomyces]|uniref:hypothetical protein n=1 Tax=unclassified Streptomyces TaxID=2593676 RepID=UPI002E0E8196|nr:hypothetical protein OG457_47195 [Streptomyces sp. NBC_01207]WTA16737.1 hypothetical protein OG365_00900 [Streptomyces sp. NBC_00853]